ncbi:MAG: HIT domain-containing protein [Candidatus Eremiobacteraeota bacterium]|nr:HIT domain-containing protein [Candidatus Eremiobacteraeota bacterium]
MEDCIFCKIGAREVAAKEVYRDEAVVAIEDLNPQAPTHLLVLPLAHHDTVVEAAENGPLTARLMSVASTLGVRCSESGFRLVVNTGTDGGQTVGHVHVHVLAGRRMAWPPG